MSRTTKRNVEQFNADVLQHGGYRYAEHPTYSAIVSNKRINDEAERIIRRLGNVRSIIDVGCGDGTYTGELKARLPQISFTGFDPASEAIRRASERIPDCKFMVGDILNPATFPQMRFDLAIVRGVIHHLPSQLEAVRNTSMLSHRILIIEPNGNNPILKWIEKNSAYHIEHEEQSFSSGFLSSLCARSGLAVRSLSFIGFVPFFFPTLPAKIIYALQPVLERVPYLAKFFGAQIVILAERNA